MNRVARSALLGFIGSAVAAAAFSPIPSNLTSASIDHSAPRVTSSQTGSVDPTDRTVRPAIPDLFTHDHWWDTPRTIPPSRLPGLPIYGRGTQRWTYPDFPLACNDQPGDADLPAVQVLWLYPDNQPLDVDADKVRASIAAATSIFAASAHAVINDTDALRTDLAPRWVMNTRLCQVRIERIEAPHAVLAKNYHYLATGPDDVDGVWQWLKDRGYDRPDRKYLDLMQQDNGKMSLLAENFDNGKATLDNPANYSAHAGVVYGPSATAEWWQSPRYIAHEMSHALGALTGHGAPHTNPDNPGHPSDCFDVLAYCDGTKGEFYPAGCGYDPSSPWSRWDQFDLARQSERLDCHDDDYWNINGAEWTTQRWAISSSSFLWGNPDQPAALSTNGLKAAIHDDATQGADIHDDAPHMRQRHH